MIKKFVMATIKIPMELKYDNSIESYSEFIDMKFEKINELPEKNNIKFDDKYIIEKINNFYSLDNSEEEEKEKEEKEEEEINNYEKSTKPMTIKKEEIKKKENKKNRITTFKIRDKILHRQTSKNHY